MIAGVLQFAPVWGSKEANFQKIKSLCEGEKMDLLVLPELSTTGYFFFSPKELEPLAEKFPGGETTDFLTWLAEEVGGYVVAGVAEKDQGKLYNSAVLVGPKGYVATYRKVHLFSSEKKVFEPGNLGFPVFDLGFARVGMMVCFDWIFPESARSLALRGAEIIAHPANLVLPYCPKAAATRALENRVFYMLADRVGEEKRRNIELRFIGQSRIIDLKGEILASIEDDEKLITARIEPSLARDKHVTPDNDLFLDRRPEQYRL